MLDLQIDLDKNNKKWRITNYLVSQSRPFPAKTNMSQLRRCASHLAAPPFQERQIYLFSALIYAWKVKVFRIPAHIPNQCIKALFSLALSIMKVKVFLYSDISPEIMHNIGKNWGVTVGRTIYLKCTFNHKLCLTNPFFVQPQISDQKEPEARFSICCCNPLFVQERVNKNINTNQKRTKTQTKWKAHIKMTFYIHIMRLASC